MNKARCAAAVFGIVLALALHTGTANAQGSLADFNSAVSEAYAPFRIAAAYLRTGNPMPAAIELDAAREAWGKRVMPFADTPPDIFSDDPDFSRSLAALGEHLEKAYAAADSGIPENGMEPVRAFRQELSDVRVRNGFYILADCLLDLSAAMDAVWVYRHEPPNFEDRAAATSIALEVGALSAVTDRCDRLARPTDRADPKYERLMGGMLKSLIPLKESIADGDTVRMINVLREQRSLERLLAMEFG